MAITFFRCSVPWFGSVYCSPSYQRLEAVTRSPVFSQLSETLDGLVTIRAFGMQSESLSNLGVLQSGLSDLLALRPVACDIHVRLKIRAKQGRANLPSVATRVACFQPKAPHHLPGVRRTPSSIHRSCAALSAVLVQTQPYLCPRRVAPAVFQRNPPLRY